MISTHFNRSLLSASLQTDTEVIEKGQRLEEQALGTNLNVIFARNRANISDDSEDEKVDDGCENTLETEVEEQIIAGIAEMEENARENVFLNRKRSAPRIMYGKQGRQNVLRMRKD